jgi:hypothetical protein
VCLLVAEFHAAIPARLRAQLNSIGGSIGGTNATLTRLTLIQVEWSSIQAEWWSHGLKKSSASARKSAAARAMLPSLGRL